MENAARPSASDERRKGGNPTAEAVAVRQADDLEPTQVSEVVVTARRPDWLHRQMSRARYGLEGLLSGRPLDGEAYYGLPSVQPRTSQEHAEHAEFIRQRDAFHAQTQSRDHLQRNIDAARRNPGKYVGDVALGALKGVGQEALGSTNGALAGYALQHPEAAVGADAVNRLVRKRVFDVGQGPFGLPTVQISQPEALRPRGDIQNQWSYLGRFGGAVGTGALAEAALPAKVAAPVYRPPKPTPTPDGRYYSVAYEMKLDPVYWGRGPKVQNNRANAQLDTDLLSDPVWAADMEKMIPDLQQSVSKTGGREDPTDWMWHHEGVARPGMEGAAKYGYMQLVPKNQHYSGSIFWNAFHPDPRRRGGYAIWAIPAGAPRR